MIHIKSNDRVLILGATRDGKTTLSLKIIDIMNPNRLVVINQGAEPIYFELFGDATPTPDLTFPTVQHVTIPIIENRKVYDKWLWPLIEKGNTTIFFDELRLIAEATNYGQAIMYLYQMGARRGMGVIAINQRVLTIPKFCINQADHIFVAHQQGDDVKALERETHQKWGDIIQNRQEYQWIHWSRHQKEPPQYVTGGLTHGKGNTVLSNTSINGTNHSPRNRRADAHRNTTRTIRG